MRPSRIAALLVLAAAPLTAQQAGKLKVELHYATGGDAWVATSKPAYVALFDISRAGVSQLYPIFSAQAQMQAGVERRVNLHVPAPLPVTETPWSSSLVALSAVPRTNLQWPHILLVVASTSPLRVGNAWASNVSINHSLFQEHHFTDTETDEGINALVEMVRPLDPEAEVVLDRIEAISQSVNAGSSYASFDPNKVALGYDCVDGNNEYFSVVPNMGANCTALREIPRTLLSPNANASVATVTPGKADTASVSAKQRKQPDTQNISDPAQIRAFVDAMKPRGSNAFKAAAAVGGTPPTATLPADAAAKVNRRLGDAAAPHINAQPKTYPADRGAPRQARPNAPPQAPRGEPTPASRPTISPPPAPPSHPAPTSAPTATPATPAPAIIPVKPPAD